MEQTVTGRYDQETLNAAAKVLELMATDPKRWGGERQLLRLAAKKILAIQEKADQ